MSVTYTCKRLANAFLGTNGEKIYLLSDVIYEGNVRPHMKDVEIFAFGELPSVMQAIFFAASGAESGSLNTPDKELTPERYIKSCLNALKNPAGYDGSAELDLTCPSYMEGALDGIKSYIRDQRKEPTVIGCREYVETHHLFNRMPKAYTPDGKISYFDPADAALAYTPKKAKNPTPCHYPKFAKIKTQYYDKCVDIDDEGNAISYPETDHYFLGSFICDQWERELKYPGAYKTSIPTYRKMIVEAGYANDRVLCHVIDVDETFPDADEDTKSGYRSRRVRIMGDYGEEFPLSIVREGDLDSVISSRVVKLLVNP